MSTTPIRPVPIGSEQPVLHLVDASFEDVTETVAGTATQVRPEPVWTRLIKVAVGSLQISIALATLLAYPALTYLSHTIEDGPLSPAAGTWSTGEAAVATGLLARELDGPGWVSDRPDWHPQARLTALPAWQTGLASALSEWIAARARTISADGDLTFAARLLDPSQDANAPMVPRLKAASEALKRFDGRVGNGFVDLPASTRILEGDLARAADWAEGARADLSMFIAAPHGWPANRGAIEAYYTAKARANVARNMLAAMGTAHREALGAQDLEGDWDHVQNLWARAADQRPFIIFNQDGDGLFEANHLAVLAFYLLEAETASRTLARYLSHLEAAPAPATER